MNNFMPSLDIKPLSHHKGWAKYLRHGVMSLMLCVSFLVTHPLYGQSFTSSIVINGVTVSDQSALSFVNGETFTNGGIVVTGSSIVKEILLNNQDINLMTNRNSIAGLATTSAIGIFGGTLSEISVTNGSSINATAAGIHIGGNGVIGASVDNINVNGANTKLSGGFTTSKGIYVQGNGNNNGNVFVNAINIGNGAVIDAATGILISGANVGRRGDANSGIRLLTGSTISSKMAGINFSVNNVRLLTANTNSRGAVLGGILIEGSSSLGAGAILRSRGTALEIGGAGVVEGAIRIGTGAQIESTHGTAILLDSIDLNNDFHIAKGVSVSGAMGALRITNNNGKSARPFQINDLDGILIEGNLVNTGTTHATIKVDNLEKFNRNARGIVISGGQILSTLGSTVTAADITVQPGLVGADLGAYGTGSVTALVPSFTLESDSGTIKGNVVIRGKGGFRQTGTNALLDGHLILKDAASIRDSHNRILGGKISGNLIIKGENNSNLGGNDTVTFENSNLNGNIEFHSANSTNITFGNRSSFTGARIDSFAPTPINSRNSTINLNGENATIGANNARVNIESQSDIFNLNVANGILYGNFISGVSNINLSGSTASSKILLPRSGGGDITNFKSLIVSGGELQMGNIVGNSSNQTVTFSGGTFNADQGNAPISQIQLQGGNDKLELSGAANIRFKNIILGDGNDTATFSGGESLLLGAVNQFALDFGNGNNRFDLSGGRHNISSIGFGTGADIINISGGTNSIGAIETGDGRDVITYNGGTATNVAVVETIFDTGNGNDDLIIDDASLNIRTTLKMGGGADKLIARNKAIVAITGIDFSTGNSSRLEVNNAGMFNTNHVNGGSGNDAIFVSGLTNYNHQNNVYTGVVIGQGVSFHAGDNEINVSGGGLLKIGNVTSTAKINSVVGTTGSDKITVTGSVTSGVLIRSTLLGNSISFGDGLNVVNVNNQGRFQFTNSFETGNNNDTITIDNGELIGGLFNGNNVSRSGTVTLGAGDDRVTISKESRVELDILDLGAGNDMLMVTDDLLQSRPNVVIDDIVTTGPSSTFTINAGHVNVANEVKGFSQIDINDLGKLTVGRNISARNILLRSDNGERATLVANGDRTNNIVVGLTTTNLDISTSSRLEIRGTSADLTGAAKIAGTLAVDLLNGGQHVANRGNNFGFLNIRGDTQLLSGAGSLGFSITPLSLAGLLPGNQYQILVANGGISNSSGLVTNLQSAANVGSYRITHRDAPTGVSLSREIISLEVANITNKDDVGLSTTTTHNIVNIQESFIGKQIGFYMTNGAVITDLNLNSTGQLIGQSNGLGVGLLMQGTQATSGVAAAPSRISNLNLNANTTGITGSNVGISLAQGSQITNLTNKGKIEGQNHAAIQLGSAVTNLTAIIQTLNNEGIIKGGGDGILIDTRGSIGVINNNGGQILSGKNTSNYGINVKSTTGLSRFRQTGANASVSAIYVAENSQISNGLHILAGRAGKVKNKGNILDADGTALELGSNNSGATTSIASIINNATISGQRGIVMNNDAVVSGGITNNENIYGNSSALATVSLQGKTIFTNAAGASISNAAANGTALELFGTMVTATTSGNILGHVTVNNGAVLNINGGTVSGNIISSSGGSNLNSITIRNNAVVNGNISLGTGNQTININEAQITGNITANGGDRFNIVNGSGNIVGNVTFSGGSNTLSIDGAGYMLGSMMTLATIDANTNYNGVTAQRDSLTVNQAKIYANSIAGFESMSLAGNAHVQAKNGVSAVNNLSVGSGATLSTSSITGTAFNDSISILGNVHQQQHNINQVTNNSNYVTMDLGAGNDSLNITTGNLWLDNAANIETITVGNNGALWVKSGANITHGNITVNNGGRIIFSNNNDDTGNKPTQIAGDFTVNSGGIVQLNAYNKSGFVDTTNAAADVDLKNGTNIQLRIENPSVIQAGSVIDFMDVYAGAKINYGSINTTGSDADFSLRIDPDDATKLQIVVNSNVETGTNRETLSRGLSRIVGAAGGQEKEAIRAYLTALSTLVGQGNTSAIAIQTALADNPDVKNAVDLVKNELLSDQSVLVAGGTIQAQKSSVKVVANRLAAIRQGIDLATGFDSGSSLENLSMWMQGHGRLEYQADNNGKSGYDANTVGYAIGLDTEMTSRIVAGMSYNHSQTASDGINKNLGNTTEVTTNQLNFYGNYDGDMWFVNGMIGFAKNDYKAVRRSSIAGTTSLYQGEFTGNVVTMQGGAGLIYHYGTSQIIPQTELIYSNVSIDAYNETTISGNNVGALSFASQGYNYLQARGGIEYINTGSYFSPYINGNLLLDVIPVKSTVKSKLNVADAPTITTSSEASDRVGFSFGTGMTMDLDSATELDVNYNLEIRSGYTGHNGQGTFRVYF